jgi:hypothetical protein
MAKRLAIKVGEYTDRDGKTKGEYIKIGSIMSGDHGEYVLLDPTVSLAGALMKQSVYNRSKNKPARPTLMVNVFDDSRGEQQGNNQAAPKQQQAAAKIDDDIPF